MLAIPAPTSSPTTSGTATVGEGKVTVRVPLSGTTVQPSFWTGVPVMVNV